MFSMIAHLFNQFRKNNSGLALTEYLLLLGLLTGAVVVAVLTFGVNLGNAWGAWQNWLTAPELAPTDISGAMAGAGGTP